MPILNSPKNKPFIISKMNYHIMVQDKFLDSYIEDVYAIKEEKNNIFWFRGNRKDNGIIKTKHKVEYIGNDICEIERRLNLLNPTDKIFIHLYDNFIAELVYNLPNRIYVMLWGSEFYCEPFWYHTWVYDKLTLKEVKNRFGYSTIKFSLNPVKFLKQIYGHFRFKKKIRNSYELKNKFVGRIDFFIFLEHNKLFFQDYHKIKKLYPSFKAKNLPGFYDQNFDRAVAVRKNKNTIKDEINLLLGNSAVDTNNHLDAFKILKKVKNIKVYCLLSYGGDQSYIDYIIKKGREIFGDRFVPITNFMNREEYIEFINTINILFMYSNRQQAFGNICSFLSLGKPVFLKNENTIKGYLDAMGVGTYNAQKIHKIDLEKVIHENDQKFARNFEILKANISQEKRLKDLKATIN